MRSIRFFPSQTVIAAVLAVLAAGPLAAHDLNPPVEVRNSKAAKALPDKVTAVSLPWMGGTSSYHEIFRVLATKPNIKRLSFKTGSPKTNKRSAYAVLTDFPALEELEIVTEYSGDDPEMMATIGKLKNLKSLRLVYI